MLCYPEPGWLVVQERDPGDLIASGHVNWPQVSVWALCMRYCCHQGSLRGTKWTGSMLGMMLSAPMKTRPSPVISLQRALLHTQGHIAGSPLCSQACSVRIVWSWCSWPSSVSRNLFALCICQNLLAAEKFFFVILLHLSLGVTSCFWKGLFHNRTLMLQPSILRTLVLGWFCGSAG